MFQPDDALADRLDGFEVVADQHDGFAGVLKTAEAVTPMPGLIVTFTLITLLYLFLGSIVAWMLYSQIIRSPVTRDWSRTYTPGPKIEVKG